MLALGACAAGGGGEAGGGTEQDVSSGASQDATPPVDHRMAKLHLGMAPKEVSAIMGGPTSSETHLTGAAWIPFNWGVDTHHVEWRYRHEGRVVFAPGWWGRTKVIRIEYDPTEDGR